MYTNPVHYKQMHQSVLSQKTCAFHSKRELERFLNGQEVLSESILHETLHNHLPEAHVLLTELCSPANMIVTDKLVPII